VLVQGAGKRRRRGGENGVHRESRWRPPSRIVGAMQLGSSGWTRQNRSEAEVRTIMALSSRSQAGRKKKFDGSAFIGGSESRKRFMLSRRRFRRRFALASLVWCCTLGDPFGEAGPGQLQGAFAPEGWLPFLRTRRGRWPEPASPEGSQAGNTALAVCRMAVSYASTARAGHRQDRQAGPPTRLPGLSTVPPRA
jgi:hypothetical protein